MWYLKDSGDNYSSIKCPIDKCYYMPYINGDERDMQVVIPPGYDVARIYFADLQGNRLHSVTGVSEDYSIITTEDFTLVTFRIPTLGEVGGCPYVQTGEEDGCTVDMSDWTGFPAEVQALAASYLANDPTVEIVLVQATPPFTQYNLSNNEYPFIYETGDHNLIFNVLCSMFTVPGAYNFYFKQDGDPTLYGGVFRDAEAGGNPMPVFSNVNCFRFEIPMLVDGVEVETMHSEPFRCVECLQTMEIESDYCLSEKDVFDELYFKFNELEGEVLGSKSSFSNKMRVELALKTMPSRLVKDSNTRCNTYRSSVEKAFKLQGFETDFPDYMIHAVESIVLGKLLYINDTRYELNAEAVASERGVQGYNMKRLDVLLKQCEQRVVFPCVCTEPPVNCEDNPVTASFVILPAPLINGDGLGYFGVDNSYLYAEVYDITGGVGALTISGWSTSGQADPVMADVPGTAITAFDDSASVNFFRRTDYDPCTSCFSIICFITDSRGCTYQQGLTVDLNDLRCVEQEGFFEIGTVTSTTIEVINTAPALVSIDYSLDGISYSPTGVLAPSPFTITGLTANTEYSIFLRVSCAAGVDNKGIIGPEYVTTLP